MIVAVGALVAVPVVGDEAVDHAIEAISPGGLPVGAVGPGLIARAVVHLVYAGANQRVSFVARELIEVHIAMRLAITPAIAAESSQPVETAIYASGYCGITSTAGDAGMSAVGRIRRMYGKMEDLTVTKSSGLHALGRRPMSSP